MIDIDIISCVPALHVLSRVEQIHCHFERFILDNVIKYIKYIYMFLSGELVLVGYWCSLQIFTCHLMYNTAFQILIIHKPIVNICMTSYLVANCLT